MHERVTGPFNGYYIAAYACEMGEMGSEYLGYYKVCRKSAPYLDAVALVEDCCETVSLTAEAALVRAEHMAKLRISALPERRSRQAWAGSQYSWGLADSSLPTEQ